MITRIAEVEFSILSLGAFLLEARVGVLDRLSLARMITSCNGHGAILRVPFLLIKEWFSFGILRLLERIDANPLLAFFAIARLCEFDRSALGDQWRFLYEYDEGMLIVEMGWNR